MKVILPVYPNEIKTLKEDKYIDIYELRAESIKNISELEDVLQKLKKFGKKIIFTVRTKKEGGKIGISKGKYLEFIRFVMQSHMTDFVDIEINTILKSELISLVEETGYGNIIYSVHKNESSLSFDDIEKCMEDATEVKAKILKLADRASSLEEIKKKIKVLSKKDLKFEIIYISMGEIGKFTRVRSKYYTPKYTFLTLKDRGLGQFPLSAIKKVKTENFSVVYSEIFDSSLGKIRVIADDKKVLKIEIEKFQDDLFIPILGSNGITSLAKREISEYLSGNLKKFSVLVNMGDSNFQKRVYKHLMDTGYGELISYKELAERIGNEKSSRAVGNVMARNLIPIIIPCHRVIKSDGDLGNYRYGKDIKKKLINLEERC